MYCIEDRRHGTRFKKKTKFCRCPLNPLLLSFPLLAYKGKPLQAPQREERLRERKGRKPLPLYLLMGGDK